MLGWLGFLFLPLAPELMVSGPDHASIGTVLQVPLYSSSGWAPHLDAALPHMCISDGHSITFDHMSLFPTTPFIF